MAPTLHVHGLLGDHRRAFGYLFLFLVMGVFASCHPPQSKKQQTLSSEDSLLGIQFPLPEHLQEQKALLLKHSKPAKGVIVPDGEYLEGNFNSGAVELILDEIDGEPSYFYGHLEEDSPDVQMVLVIYGVSDKVLDGLVPGQKYRVHWIETVVFMKPFDDDRYRYFLTYRIDEH